MLTKKESVLSLKEQITQLCFSIFKLPTSSKNLLGLTR